MKDMTNSTRLLVASLAMTLALGFTAWDHAQEAPPGTQPERFPALEALNASVQKQRRELECRQITDLAALAGKASPPEAEAAYRQLFGLAIAEDVCPEAVAAAGRCLARGSFSRDTRSMAALVQMLGRSKKGEHDQALADLDATFQPPAAAGQAAPAPDFDMALAVGEAFLRRLICDGRYDVAHKLCDMACDADSDAILKEHFEDRMARIDLHGKPAPPIAGTDVDGKPVSLADSKGKVVIVDFWATWCPPCVASIPALEMLVQKYGDKGLVILGVNVIAMHEDAKDQTAVLQGVQRFHVNHRVTWVNLLNGHGASDFAAAYHVERIPANFLVGRDGKIVALERYGEMLEKAVAQALGGHEKTGDQP
jgi:thiol-disulfide isomerase/thioredoxin